MLGKIPGSFGKFAVRITTVKLGNTPLE